MGKSLTRVIQWGHELLAEVICAGDLVVDLTAGNGYDTLALANMTGSDGQVVAFDVQQEALDATAGRVAGAGFRARITAEIQPLKVRAGIDLVLASHDCFRDIVPGAPKGVIANLGYLPGGDRSVITCPETTLSALQQGCHALQPGGRLAVVVYPGHPGGAIEAAAVSRFFAGLDQKEYHVLLVKVQNRDDAPFLLVAERGERL